MFNKYSGRSNFILPLALSLLVLLLLISFFPYKSEESTEQFPSFDWIESDYPVDFSWATQVGARKMPHGKTFYADDFGAVGDTSVISTRSIQEAIDFCSRSGGGTVSFKAGYYATGALFIKEGVNLEIPENVTLVAGSNIEDYPEFRTRVAGIEMDWPAAVINILDTHNASLSGKGTIDCQGKVYWDKYWEMRREYEKKGLRWIVDYDCKRVRGILVSDSRDITLKDFTIMRTGFWGIQLLYSQNCTVDGLTINNNIGGNGPSTDGIDIDSSSYILIENCDIDCNDDNICLKAGRDADGLRVNRPTEYVVVRNCITRKGAGLITCGSETSGGIRHILAHDLQAAGTSTVLRIKSAMTRGGSVEDICISNVTADGVRCVLSAEMNWNPSYSYSELPSQYEGKELEEHWKAMLTPVEPKEKGYPFFRNVYMANVKAVNVQQFILTSGTNDSLRLENFGLYNMDIEAIRAGKIAFSDGFSLKEIKLKTIENRKLELIDNINIKLDVEYDSRDNRVSQQ